ncbi:hypothetical protein [Micropruina sonneratiae]|nr:hypothetical protein [Micropruina sp. KQZ13P-5]MCW3159547.1 hypothetical protein [Micropruina sp. KQZ13P-5]
MPNRLAAGPRRAPAVSTDGAQDFFTAITTHRFLALLAFDVFGAAGTVSP